MLSEVHKKDIDELYRTSIVQQTAFWSLVKKKIGQESLALNFKSPKSSLFTNANSDDNIHSDVLVIIQQLNNNDSIAYVPYGPELEPGNEFQGVFLEELSECLRSFLPKNCFMIRYDLCWEVFWAEDRTFFDPQGNLIGEPSVRSQEMRLNFNTIRWNLRKAQSNILPTNTLYLDLQPDLDTIMGRIKPKTRYNIRLSQRKGVVVRIADLADLGIWYDLYKETAIRNGIYLNDIKYFEAILTTKADKTKSPAEVFYLIAESNHKPLAAMFLIISGNRGSYLYGASSSSNRNYMATYALQWEAIKISKEKGCREYDMFGISPNKNITHPLYGLYKFKMGFGGEIFHSLGCWDYPFDAAKYNIFKSLELRTQGFHIN
ncbi:MAG: peptidoglycan bridge formation glycyltransferase FemA/FemB family protein [Bacteroidales bacterium]|nr:peptidoglycan bridge formation glycyltransferase FemA/FemB family protein [Bacteroidales bacterium]